METLLNFSGCRTVINDNLITCTYPTHFNAKRWEIALGEKEICYKADEKKELRFQVDELKELQFEMSNGGNSKAREDIPAAIAYVILKTDPDPKDLFYLMINEQYVLLNQTKAYDFCSKILHHIGDRYGIPVNYKLSIDTKKKQRNLIWLPVILIITFILIYLRIRLG